MQAVKDRRKVIVTYFSGEYNLNLTRLCVPVRYESPDAGEESDCYYFWDSGGEVGERVLGLRVSQIIYMELGDETFDPDEYIVPDKGKMAT
jgi:hypothetical protein